MMNSFASVHPELISEWSDKNYPITPDNITFGSNKNVWWKGSCAHEWQASVKSRSSGEKCPICSGKRVVKGINDLATLKPELVKEWSDKNILKPTEVSIGSHKKIIWKCKLGHEWEASVKSRAINHTGCPYCSNNKVLIGFNDLASQLPKVATEWSERNYPLEPTMVTAYSNQKVWWKCSKGHEWYALIPTRSNGSKCPSMNKSHCYNPFVYLQNDNDVQRLVTNLFKSTTPKGSQSNDPFWDTAASMLLLSLIFYLHYFAPPEEQNFPMVMEMLRAGAIQDEEGNFDTPLDDLFGELEEYDPEHIAVKYYRNYHSGSAKTLKSIQITLASRLEKFNLDSLASLTNTDELDLPSMGEKKVALFALIPDNDSSFNFLVSILYTQLFQQLFYSADHIHGGALPVQMLWYRINT